ncbi:hypothetical protein QTP88_022224 [Uroleucon formosanum]
MPVVQIMVFALNLLFLRPAGSIDVPIFPIDYYSNQLGRLKIFLKRGERKKIKLGACHCAGARDSDCKSFRRRKTNRYLRGYRFPQKLDLLGNLKTCKVYKKYTPSRIDCRGGEIVR